MRISLPDVRVGDILIRYINYSLEKGNFTVTNHMERHQPLLFLGADVLATSKQPVNHHVRIHSRYAKLGLATKVTMNGVTVDGIANSKCLWFYSILGLFRVSFEYLNIDFQSYCLQHLTDMWLIGCHQAHLPESLTLQYSDCDSVRVIRDAPADNNQLYYSDAETASCQIACSLSVKTCSSSTSLISDSGWKSCTTQSDNIKQENVHFICSEVATVDSATNTISHAAAAAADDDNLLCASPNTLYHYICDRVHSVTDANEKRRLCDSLTILLQFFDTEYLAADTASTESFPAFPLCLLEQYTNLIKDNVGFYSAEGYDVGDRQGVWLRLISDWLGTEFARLRTTVNQRVEVFKADNIDRISDLPSPRTVVHRLFPHSMILLMLRWMDSGDCSDDLLKFRAGQRIVDLSQPGACLGTSELWSHRDLDHSYVADDSPESKLFSFIQLILEFANGCLVSGISHVLYPRLLQAQL